MRLNGLRAFRFVFEDGSIAAAAERLHLSAPAVSRLVSGLEEELGLKLFQRSGRNLIPSPEGTRFYAQTHRLLASIDDLPRIAEDIREGQSLSVRLLTMPRLAELVALPAIAELRALVPQMAIQLDVMSRRELKGEITRLNYDFAIAALPVDDTVATVEAVAVRDIGVLVPIGHRFAERRQLSPVDLMDEPMIVLPHQTRHRQEMDDIFRSFSIEPRIAVTVSSIAAAVSLVGRGTGVCLADGIIGQSLEGGGMRLLRLEPARSVTYGLIRPPVPREHQHTELIANTLRKQFRKITGSNGAECDEMR